MNLSCEAILFDLGNTLVSYYRAEKFNPILRRSINKISEVISANGCSLDADAAFQHAKHLNREEADGRVWPLEERLTELIGSAVELTPSVMDELVGAFLAPIFATASVDPQAFDTLERLREKGLKTEIVSNTPWGSPSDHWRQELDRLGLLNRVDEVVFCVDVGWRKPAVQPFERALSLLQADPASTLFVGDDVRWDVLGARRAGIEPVLVSEEASGDEGLIQISELRELVALIESRQ